jgi:hypothetical protein
MRILEHAIETYELTYDNSSHITLHILTPIIDAAPEWSPADRQLRHFIAFLRRQSEIVYPITGTPPSQGHASYRPMRAAIGTV